MAKGLVSGKELRNWQKRAWQLAKGQGKELGNYPRGFATGRKPFTTGRRPSARGQNHSELLKIVHNCSTTMRSGLKHVQSGLKFLGFLFEKMAGLGAGS